MSTPASTAFRRGVHLFNTERGHDAIAGHTASQGFIDAILGEIERGYGFVPFAGAGFSVSAGIPIINQFSNYLQRCICVAVGAETDCERPQLWNPRTDKWPPFIDLSRPEPPPVPWRDLVYKRFQAEDLLPKDKGNPWIYQEAFGAMAEWRTSLYFLSRLNLDSPRLTKSKTPTPVLGVPDQDVIDACLRQVLRANVPSLNHAMLATLSQLLRIDTILTTNFDDLIEKAFLDSRNRLEVFDVHLGDRLPDYAAVSRVRSIVKIHGSQNSLRADYSLDGPPSYEDMCMFASYVAGWDMVRLKGTHGSRNHLLIFGVGVTEQRTKGFLKHALDRLPDLKLFFVCYRNEDVEAVRNFMEGCIGEGESASASASEKPPRCYVLRHTESGLLLLHLYQSVRKSLPVNSALFPSTTRLSLPVLPHLSCDFESDQYYKDFREGITLALREESPTRPHLIVATSPNGISGVTSAAAEVLRDIESRNLCLWIEMHDIHSADDLFEAFQEAAHYKLGRSDWTPLYSANDGRPREEEIQRIMDSSTSPIVIFLDARETPGANLESERSEFKDARDNGWLDGGAKPEDSKRVESFVNLIEQWISKPQHGVNRITVILLCRGAHPPIVRSLSGLPAHILSLQKAIGTNAVTVWDVDEIVLGALWWAETNEKRTFLQSIVSMQRTRHLAVIWDASVSVPQRVGRKTDEERTRWLDQLEEKKVLRRKDGGFVWVDSRYRQKIRACLTLTSDQIQQASTDPSLFLRWVGVPLPHGLAGADLLNRLMEWNAVEKQAEIQRSIAMWYLKVFDATGTSRAILEAADHLCYSAASLIRGQKFPEAIGRLASIRHLLKKHSFRIQTEGHPCSSKRRLDVICNYWTRSGVAELITRPGWVCDLEEQDKLKKSIAKLQCASLEVTRAICREIGEDRDAYKRHREIGIRSVISEPLNDEQVDNIEKSVGQDRDKSLFLFIQRHLTDQARPNKSPRNDDWLRWWRWCGLLGNQSRSFALASKSLSLALHCSMNSERTFAVPRREDRKTLLEWNPLDIQARHEEGMYKCNLEILHTIEVAASTLMLQSHTLDRDIALTIGPVPQAYQDKSNRYLEQAELLALRGLDIIVELKSNHLKGVDRDAELQWTKSRLMMVAGIASLRDPHRKEHSPHAMSLLGDAAACLHSTMPERARADIALVELRRAEVRIREAGATRLYEQKSIANAGYSFERWTFDRLEGSSVREPLDKMGGKSQLEIVFSLRRDLFPEPEGTFPGIEPAKLELASSLNKELRNVTARATDAIRFLDRAIPTLRERRRNVWWTTWYFERRMGAISFLLWSSVAESASPIPFLGLEAAMRKTDTEADMLLKDAVRMIRVDAYRLAMVLLFYASCARALDLRLQLDKDKSVYLDRRLETMRNLLEYARRQLTDVINRRNTDIVDPPDTSKHTWQNAPMDAEVQRVVERVQNKVLNVIVGLTESIATHRAKPRSATLT